VKALKSTRHLPKLTAPLSNAGKVFWPEEGYTKLDLANFYQTVFPKLAPYLKDRLLTLERCPDGMGGQCFYQKEKPKGMPPSTPTRRIGHITEGGKFTNYVVGGSLATQIALVNLGCIAVHVMAARSSSPRQPDWVSIDIDPSSGEFKDAAQAGLLVKEVLDSLNLVSFAKTSGSRGMHVMVPIRQGPDANEVLAFSRDLVVRVAANHPTQLTVEHSVAARRGRVYLDPFRNGFGQTVVAPYSVRRRPHAPISTPLAWSEVRPDLSPSSFHIGNFEQRLKETDPWKDFFRKRQSLTNATRLLQKL